MSELFSEYTLKEHKKMDSDILLQLAYDPIRSNIHPSLKFGYNKSVFTLEHEGKVVAVCCVALLDFIPIEEEELFYGDNTSLDIAVLYSIWSTNVKPGCAAILVAKLHKYLKLVYYVRRIVTLSPKTEMARKFHLKNGAFIYRENETSINYEYEL